eukprot:20408-Heterococcus_DN1.PRE.3
MGQPLTVESLQNTRLVVFCPLAQDVRLVIFCLSHTTTASSKAAAAAIAALSEAERAAPQITFHLLLVLFCSFDALRSQKQWRRTQDTHTQKLVPVHTYS